MRILAIDPGSEKSAYVLLDDHAKLVAFGKDDNQSIRWLTAGYTYDSDCIAVEVPRARGMPASNDLFTTTLWAGRFMERWWDNKVGREIQFPLSINRHDVKLHHCGNARAKDSNIRQAIIDRFGGKEAAIGRKKNPGPLYGVSADVWQALAIGLLVHDCRHDVEWIREREVRS